MALDIGSTSARWRTTRPILEVAVVLSSRPYSRSAGEPIFAAQASLSRRPWLPIWAVFAPTSDARESSKSHPSMMRARLGVRYALNPRMSTQQVTLEPADAGSFASSSTQPSRNCTRRAQHGSDVAPSVLNPSLRTGTSTTKPRETNHSAARASPLHIHRKGAVMKQIVFAGQHLGRCRRRRERPVHIHTGASGGECMSNSSPIPRPPPSTLHLFTERSSIHVSPSSTAPNRFWFPSVLPPARFCLR